MTEFLAVLKLDRRKDGQSASSDLVGKLGIS